MKNDEGFVVGEARVTRKDSDMTKAKKAAAGIIVRQGDVLLRSIPASEAGKLEPAAQSENLRALEVAHGGIALAEGESSQHGHFIFGSGSKLMRYKASPGRVVVVVGEAGADMRVVGGGSGGVDRHTPIALAPGHYEVRIQRAYTAGMSRRVVD